MVLIWVTLGVEALLFVAAAGGAIVLGMAGRDATPFYLLLVGHMPVFMVGMVASLRGRPWAQTLAVIVGVLLVGVDSALVLRQFVTYGPDWLAPLLDLPGLCVLSAVWLMARSRVVPPVAPPPISGEWR